MLSGCRRAAQQRDELAPLHSITSSARRRIERDMVAAAIVDHLRLCNGGWHAARRGVGSRIWDRAKQSG